MPFCIQPVKEKIQRVFIDRFFESALSKRRCYLLTISGTGQIHLFESPLLEKYIIQYPVDGNNLVEKISYDGIKVFINAAPYFDNVPQTASEFYIGDYQPAQKWLKDRKDRELTFEDILHYKKIKVALM